MKILLLLVLAGAAAAALYLFVLDKPTPSSDARIVGVDARFTGATGASTITVDVEVEAVGAMPPVGPHLIVTAVCEAARDEATGDYALMNNAPAGERKTDAVELFTRAPFADQPVRCEITARTSDGSASASACLELGTARVGGC